jgi:polyhydroxyalkanoate synthesis regulator phasin
MSELDNENFIMTTNGYTAMFREKAKKLADHKSKRGEHTNPHQSAKAPAS